MSSTHETMIVVSEDFKKRAREVARLILRTPFTKRAWSELLFFAVGGALAAAGFAFVVFTLAAGTVLAITFLGFILIAFGIRGARGIGGIHRNLARNLLGLRIEDPEPFVSRPGLLGWLRLLCATASVGGRWPTSSSRCLWSSSESSPRSSLWFGQR